MIPLEDAWAIIKAKKDAPNYRKATGSKKCGNCKAWDDSATEDLRRVIVSGMILIAEKIIHVMRGRVNEIGGIHRKGQLAPIPFLWTMLLDV